jgi:protoporphyrinogen oxidase
MQKADVLIIGAGPAGLTAALEILRHTSLRVSILEKSSHVAGLAQSVPFASGFIDVGGHRFHTRSERVMAFWHSIKDVQWRAKERYSELWFAGEHYDYPLRIEFSALRKFGAKRALTCLRSLLLERTGEARTMADFFRHTYGPALYEIFFADYTRKVWGRSAEEMPVSWGAERLKRPGLASERAPFLYPHGGPGEFWRKVADEIEARGGVIHTDEGVESIITTKRSVRGVVTPRAQYEADAVISTLPLADLVAHLSGERRYKLSHRGLISVNLAMPNSAIPFEAQWTYVNSAHHRLARVQNYRAWDQSLVRAPDELILGAEFFASVGDELWSMRDEELVDLAKRELVSLGIPVAAQSYEHKVVRVPRAYPCYWDDFDRLNELQVKVDAFENLFSCGRQGLHRYINMDQAMLSALRAVDHLRKPTGAKAQLWEDFSSLHLPE